MIIFLPVIVHDKCINIAFNIEQTNDILSVTPVNKSELVYDIILCSNKYGINSFPLIFPLNFIILKNELICDLFYIFQMLSSPNEIDFIHLIISKFPKYKLYNNMNINNLISVLKIFNNNDNQENDNINKIYYRIMKYMNFCLAIIADDNKNIISQSSKISLIINSIKNLKISFYGNNLTIEEHIEHILNPKLIKKKRIYFYQKNQKIVKIHTNDNINKEYLSAYPKKFNNLINIKNLINILIINHFDNLFDIIIKILYKKKQNIISLLNYHIFDKIDDYYNISDDDLKNILINKISIDKFKELLLNNNTIPIDVLIQHSYYPINNYKKTLNDNFIKLLLYFFENPETINSYNINNKLKTIILFIVKMNKSFKSDDINIIYNSKIYIDGLLYQIIKIIFLGDYNNLLNINNTIKTIFINNIIVIQILNNLSWKTISKQLVIFKYLINMKDNCKKLLFIDDKLNKYYTNNMDNRLKKIIVDPLLMFNFLKKEEDFYKWILCFIDNLTKIFNNMITMDSDDYKKLARILFLYSRIKNQDNNDPSYKKTIMIFKKYNKLILFNDRINIKFKDIFKNVNINLGYLARDINNNDNITISISEDTITNSSKDITDTINKLKKKYYKYKGKYLAIKYTETATINN
jgi:hypothetical protein